MTRKAIFLIFTLVFLSGATAPPLVVMEMDNGTIEKPCSIAYVNGQFEIMTNEGSRNVFELAKVKTVRVNPSYVELPRRLEQAERDESRLAVLVTDLQTSISKLKAQLAAKERANKEKEQAVYEKDDLIRKQKTVIADFETKIQQIEDRAQKAEKEAKKSAKEIMLLTRSTLEEPEYSPPGRIEIENPTNSGQMRSVR